MPAAPSLAVSASTDPAGAFADGDRKNRRVRELVALLTALAEAPDLRRRLDALERLVRWLVVADKGLPAPAGVALPGEVGTVWRRLAVTLALLARAPALGEGVRAAVAAIVAQTHPLALFAETGLPHDRGIGAETTNRVFRRILPVPRDDDDLSRLLLRLFPSERELAWIEGMPPDLFQELAAALAPSDAVSPLVAGVADGLALLGARAQALGLSEDLRARSRPGPLRGSPFYELPRACDRFLALLDQPAHRVAAEREWRAAVEGCRLEIRCVLERLESAGVSVDVVYSVEAIEQMLARMERLVAVLAAAAGPERAVAAHRLVAVLVRARLDDRSLLGLLRTNLHLMSRKIIERAGKTGEHYITYTRREYWHMIVSAGGGGLLTTATAALKVVIAGRHYPLFVEGFLAGTNYAMSFLVMQLVGMTLATKQPSMTAAQLAGAIRDANDPARLDDLVTHVARICRSQLAAAAGNVSMVSVGAIGMHFFWTWRYGAPFLTPEKAESVFKSLHLTQSGTVFYAMLTGVVLWLSSLAAGWVENFAVYRRLPQAIAEHRLGRFVGERTMQALSRAFARNISGFGGCVALGFMLGMVPILGIIFGLPIDVRHVTLSTGTLAMAVCALGTHMLRDPAFLWAAAGIAVIFVCNLGVSFTLALAVALRAREVPLKGRLRLLSALLGRFVRRPGQFLLPPGAGERGPAH